MNDIERIAQLKEQEAGSSEENVKQKIVAPLLELLGHKRENLDFEYKTRKGGKLDIFIHKDIPFDCKIIIDTKNYNEELDSHIEQIRGYTFDENPLLTVIANGKELRIYGQLRGVAFEKSLLYSIKRENFTQESTWSFLSDLLGYENLKSKSAIKKVDERECQIKNAIEKEEQLKQEHKQKLDLISININEKEHEIEKLHTEEKEIKDGLIKDIGLIWKSIGLPATESYGNSSIPIRGSTDSKPGYDRKSRKISFNELKQAGLITNNQKFYLCYGARSFSDEYAHADIATNNLKYKDGKLYSKSELARILLKKHGCIQNDSVRGPQYWKTEKGDLLRELEDRCRKQSLNLQKY